MGDIQAGQSINMFLIGGMTVFFCVLLHFIYKFVFRSKENDDPQPETQNNTEVPASEASSETAVTEARYGKSKKRSQWKGKSEFSHPWLMKNLKGHPGNVLMVDFSANGKFMAATCNENVTAVDTASIAARRRRARDRRRPPPPPPTTTSPQNMSTEQLAEALRPYILSSTRMLTLGYPVEVEPNSTYAAMYINPPPPRNHPNRYTKFDVNAPEFVPGSQSDSGRGSLGSSPRSDSDEEADTVQRLCVRCDKTFRMTRDGEYVNEDPCVHHWGRCMSGRFTCCNTMLGTRGCTTARYHVWSGKLPGMTGPVDGFVRARSPRGGVFAIDTEMCYTTAGLELASVAVIAADGRLVYKSLVKPSSRVVDHNTRFSGIRPRDLARAAKTLRDVQNDILGFIGTDTIIVGHALENDFRVLKLLHNNVVDTCDLYPHPHHLPYRRSLRALSKQYLGREVQQGSGGHCALEDARAALDLVLLKVKEGRPETRPPQPPRRSYAIPIYEPYDPLVSGA